MEEGSIVIEPAWNADGFVFKYVPKKEEVDFDPTTFRVPLNLPFRPLDIASEAPADDLPAPPAGDGILELGMVEPVF